MNTAEVESRAWALLAQIAEHVRFYRPHLYAFVWSRDTADRTVPESLRIMGWELAWLVASESDEFIELVHRALAWACSGDGYATRELVGRFRGAVRMARVVSARHPEERSAGIIIGIMERCHVNAGRRSVTRMTREVAAEAC
jgi:hypothetical protein